MSHCYFGHLVPGHQQRRSITLTFKTTTTTTAKEKSLGEEKK
jgi:hypothetical protein